MYNQVGEAARREEEREGWREERRREQKRGEVELHIKHNTPTEIMVQNTLPHLCLYTPCNQQ